MVVPWIGIDPDVNFVAFCVAQPLALREMRRASLEWMVELSRRLEPVSALVRSMQPVDVAAVNPRVHLALLAVLVVIMAWPDTMFVRHLMAGFPVV